ncbi:elongation factor Ts [Shewanella atlantica]|uniref:Elongation factor Ts n=1 Tax=Shewanella atlantica TaxID=271099 RepID=A0A431WH07_9GAMM|nr:elongation factor Ts [Shewanella atlantica]RTR34759.1 elongation factor Ts [Shewanella atlantica]
MGTEVKQKQIKELLQKLNLSINKFAGLVYEALYDDDDKEAEQKLAENIKKQLQRKTTKEEVLDSYLDILAEQPSYQALNLDKVRSQFVNHSCLNDDITMSLTELSGELDKLI